MRTINISYEINIRKKNPTRISMPENRYTIYQEHAENRSDADKLGTETHWDYLRGYLWKNSINYLFGGFIRGIVLKLS